MSQYADRAEFDAVQISLESFDVTLVDNAEATTDGEENIFVIENNPQSGKSVRCTGFITYSTATEGTFQIREVFQTSEPDDSLVTFDTGPGISVKIRSTASRTDLDRNRRGRRGVGAIFQSNMVGANNGRDARDYIYSNVLMWDANAGDYTAVAVEPLPHQTPSGQGALVVSPMTSFANRMIDEGYKTIVLLPAAQNTSGFSSNQWNPGDAVLEEAIDRFVDWHNSDPDLNRIEVILAKGGENDTLNFWTADQFRDAAISMIDYIRAQLTSRTGYDYSKLPFVFLGMNADFIAANANAVNIEAGMADIQNFSAYTWYWDTQSYSSSSGRGGLADNVHDDSDTALRNGYESYPTMINAKANRFPAGGSNPAEGTGIGTGDAESTVIAGPPKFEGVGTGTGDAEPDTNVVTGIFDGTGTGTGDAESTVTTPTSYPLTEATNPTGYFRGDDGVVLGTGNEIATLQNLIGPADDFIANSGAVLSVSNRLNFDGSSDLRMAAGMFDMTNTEGTIIIQLQITAGVPFSESDSSGFATTINASDQCQIKPAFGTNLEVINPPDIRDGTLQRWALTLDATTFRVDHASGANPLMTIHSEAKGAVQATNMLSYLGSQVGATFVTGDIDWYYVKDGDGLSLTDVNNVASEG